LKVFQFLIEVRHVAFVIHVDFSQLPQRTNIFSWTLHQKAGSCQAHQITGDERNCCRDEISFKI